MKTKIVLVDVNKNVANAMRESFGGSKEIEVLCGSMLACHTDAWVSPTNSLGNMDGGLDAFIRNYLRSGIQTRVKAEISRSFGGFLPLGAAICVPTGRQHPAYLISTPTMTESAENISATLNTALACCAAFQAIAVANRNGANIRSVAVPGLGTGTGRVSPMLCAELMWTAYNLFLDREFEDFSEVRAALEGEIGAIGSVYEDSAWLKRAQMFRQNSAHFASLRHGELLSLERGKHAPRPERSVGHRARLGAERGGLWGSAARLPACEAGARGRAGGARGPCRRGADPYVGA